MSRLSITVYIISILCSLTSVFAMSNNDSGTDDPLKIAVIGLTHTHVHWIFESEKRRDDFEIVAIVEPNADLAKRYSDQHGFNISEVYASMDLLPESKPIEAFAAFGSIYEHLQVVEFAAPRGIHVMVEKPLAVSMEHASKMHALAEEHNIHLLTNYETTWYPTNHRLKELLKEGVIGEVRKVVVHDGHKGPKKLGINSEFLDWLLDPKLNGGGAITDFGCYGVNLMTWLLDGEKPRSVTAVTQQLQPENNPKVDDEATIILAYEKSQAVIQASWNWPIGRKDMDVYGLLGSVSALNRNDLRVRIAKGYDDFSENNHRLKTRSAPLDDPFSYFAAVVRGKIIPEPYDLSSLENNMIVMEILDAAIRSSKTGQTIWLTP
ncbi:MAG: Gfo/Idh/MocA family oxidoreductase [Opitutales bacterium]|nr:Gfo/Idh/MocA family oxidoreductase [Opitutales bacterium]